MQYTSGHGYVQVAPPSMGGPLHVSIAHFSPPSIGHLDYIILLMDLNYSSIYTQCLRHVGVSA